jgi:hypothetical protein
MFTTVGPTASANWLKLAGTMGGSTAADTRAEGADPSTIITPAKAIPAISIPAAHPRKYFLKPKTIFVSSFDGLIFRRPFAL